MIRACIFLIASASIGVAELGSPPIGKDEEAVSALRAILQQGVTDRTYPGAAAIAGGFRPVASAYKWGKESFLRPVVFFEEAVGRYSYDEPQLSDEMKVMNVSHRSSNECFIT
jgi:hypothetical protein